MSENYFTALYNIDVRDKTKQKNGLNYLSWAAAWSEVKKQHPDATYCIYEQNYQIKESNERGEQSYMINRPWHDDGKTGWVKVGVTINAIENIEELPIMDLRNKPIPAESITSADANKSIQRALTKACARHGLGLYLYEGEDMPEDAKEQADYQKKCMDIMAKKCKAGEKMKEKVGELCREMLPEENGNPTLCNDTGKLEKLYKALLALRV